MLCVAELILSYDRPFSSYVSAFINCGVYVCSTEVFTLMTSIFQSKERDYTR